MKKTVLAAAMFFLIACMVSGWSQNKAGGKKGGPAGFGGMMFQMTCPAMATGTPPAFMMDMFAQNLKLSATQKTKVSAIITKSDKNSEALRTKAASAVQALRTALLAPKYDAAKVKNLAAASEKAEAAIVNANLAAWAEIRKVLTAEQSKQLNASMTPRPGQFGPPPGGAMKMPAPPKK